MKDVGAKNQVLKERDAGADGGAILKNPFYYVIITYKYPLFYTILEIFHV